MRKYERSRRIDTQQFSKLTTSLQWLFSSPNNVIQEITREGLKLVDNNHSIKNIQLLTHPIWWTTPEKMTPGEKIDFHLRGEIDEIKKLAAKNCKPYKIYLESKGK